MPNIILLLRELQVDRVVTIRTRIRITNSMLALTRRALGFDAFGPEKERARISALAAKIVDAIEADKPVAPEHQHVANSVRNFCIAGMNARAYYVNHQAGREQEMRELAAKLPVKDFAEGIRGFGLLRLAVIVGEAGDVGSFASPAKLWKRMGLAVFDGKSQRKTTDPVEAVRQGYNPRRRSEMYVIGDLLVKCNGEGRYRKLYDERKAYELARNPDMTKMHSHRRAQRYMEKELLEDLWREWRKSIT